MIAYPLSHLVTLSPCHPRSCQPTQDDHPHRRDAYETPALPYFRECHRLLGIAEEINTFFLQFDSEKSGHDGHGPAAIGTGRLRAIAAEDAPSVGDVFSHEAAGQQKEAGRQSRWKPIGRIIQAGRCLAHELETPAIANHGVERIDGPIAHRSRDAE